MCLAWVLSRLDSGVLHREADLSRGRYENVRRYITNPAELKACPNSGAVATGLFTLKA